MKTKVMVIGELLGDLISTDYVDDLSEANYFSFLPGGSPANVCATLQWLGVHAILISCVGDDGLGRKLVKNIAKTGVPINYIHITTKQPTSIVIISKCTSTPQFIAYRAADTILSTIDKELIAQVGLLHTGAFALSMEPARSTILEALAKGFEQGKDISIDWNYAAEIWTAGDENSIFNRVLEFKPLLKMSFDDVRRFLKRNVTRDQALEFLSHLSTKFVCLTCGPDGVYYKSETSDWIFRPSITVANVVDVTGAGDAFWSGFLSGWLHGLSVDDCIQKALEVASTKIQKVGPLYDA